MRNFTQMNVQPVHSAQEKSFLELIVRFTYIAKASIAITSSKGFHAQPHEEADVISCHVEESQIFSHLYVLGREIEWSIGIVFWCVFVLEEEEKKQDIKWVLNN